jgi:hypothetical protein
VLRDGRPEVGEAVGGGVDAVAIRGGRVIGIHSVNSWFTGIIVVVIVVIITVM